MTIPTRRRWPARTMSPKARSTAAACARVSSRIGERPPILAYRWRISCTSCGLVGRPPRTSCKYGSTSSRLAGPPYAIIRTATRSPAMDQLHYGADRRHVRLGEHAVAEIEDVARPAAGAGQHVPHLAVPFWRWREQRGGIEVALDRVVVSHAS